MLSFLALPLLALPALSLSIVFGGPPGLLGAPTGDLAPSQLLVIPQSLQAACNPTCAAPISEITACTDANDACVCDAALAVKIQACEQCMMTELIRTNKPMPDIKAGSNVALKAYAGACTAALKLTPVLKGSALTPAEETQAAELAKLALFVPANWDGPVSMPLSMPLTVLVVGLGGIMGVGGITILNSM